MKLNDAEINLLLTELVKSLDISPTDYQRAVKSYESVGKWLEEGYENNSYSGSFKEPSIYPQGSINLGTIVRPIKNGVESDYDIDLVCELQATKNYMEPHIVKHQVGERIKESEVYKKKLEVEGKRCWTLQYADSESKGFHMDILPCVPESVNGNIAITHKEESSSYLWKSSNPKGYAEWFKNKNVTFDNYSREQKSALIEDAYDADGFTPLYKAISEVPDQLVRTPLQRAIQIMKRHRDIKFYDKAYKPISIIITTLAAHLYNGESDIYSALKNIITKLSKHASLLRNRFFKIDEEMAVLELIRRDSFGKWYIPNPVNEDENFADKWHLDDNARARSFFNWVEQIKNDLDDGFGNDFDKTQKYFKESFNWNVPRKLVEQLEFDNIQKSIARKDNYCLSRFNVSHRDEPSWPLICNDKVNITALIKINGSWENFNSDSSPLPKNCDLLFKATTNIESNFEVYWQVVNTGEEAMSKNGLRGKIYKSDSVGIGGLKQKEYTQYTGMHWIECYIVRDGICLARSGEFVVNIE